MIVKCSACSDPVPERVAIELTVGGSPRRFCSTRCADTVAREPLPQLPQLPRRLLVAVDGSGPSLRAAELAATLAATTHGEITLLAAVDTSTLRALRLRPSVGSRIDAVAEEAERALADDARAQLDRCRRLCESAQVSCTVRVETRPPLEAILAAAEGADLLVMGSRGRGALAVGSLGSLAQRVITGTRTPVLIVH